MTYAELKLTLIELKKKVKEGELIQEEVDSWLKVNKVLRGKCFGCPHDDGIPDNYCWNCD